MAPVNEEFLLSSFDRVVRHWRATCGRWPREPHLSMVEFARRLARHEGILAGISRDAAAAAAIRWARKPQNAGMTVAVILSGSGERNPRPVLFEGSLTQPVRRRRPRRPDQTRAGRCKSTGAVRMANNDLVVYCLCAAWCGTCRDYAPVFEQLDADCADQARFAWIDIEDHEALLDDVGLEIETFPTLLICRADAPVFFGAVTPHPQTLTRLLRAALDGNFRPLGDPVVIELGRRLA